ncbi:MAG: hypothetical protein HY552_02515 [Elusimicrobia bacterium]|nr:hypothetical protein [Elusimicrobiota bacterium]
MEIFKRIAAVMVATTVAMLGASAGAADKGGQDEKAKALANPYANDSGSAALDVSGYPKDTQSGYALLSVKCAKCHTAARPLNSQFVEPEGASPGAQDAAIAALKKDRPELFRDKKVWQIEAGIWKRYVKRMMSKPGCDISNPEGKKIYEFLVYHSNHHKLNNQKAWAAARRKSLEDFRKSHPARYKELYEE